jgi:acyl carrier protein
MTREEVKKSFIELIRPAAKGFDMSSINDSTSLVADLGINSLRVVDIVLEVEDKFGIEIDDASMDRVYTIGSAVDMIVEKQSAAA